MSQQITLPSFTELSEALQKTESPLSTAEVHGLLCGMICVSADKTTMAWEKMVGGPKKDKHSRDLLRQLLAFTVQQMQEFSFEFKLLLPDDDALLPTRAEALGLWCQGFLIGLQQSKVPVEESASPEVLDALKDIIEISQVKYDEAETNDEDETAYFELVEYIRLVALMIYHELQSSKKPSHPNPDLTLH